MLIEMGAVVTWTEQIIRNPKSQLTEILETFYVEPGVCRRHGYEIPHNNTSTR